MTNATSSATQHSAGPTQPIIRTDPTQPIIKTAPTRQGKRKKKSSLEQREQEGLVTMVTHDSKQRNTVDEWSQSSATEALVSQGKMELVLVVR